MKSATKNLITQRELHQELGLKEPILQFNALNAANLRETVPILQVEMVRSLLKLQIQLGFEGKVLAI